MVDLFHPLFSTKKKGGCGGREGKKEGVHMILRFVFIFLGALIFLIMMVMG